MTYNKFTSESVTNGHPDKLADLISDRVLDLHLTRNREARVACETMVTSQKIVLAGEIGTSDPVPEPTITQAVRDIVNKVGYRDPNLQFRGDTINIENILHKQSKDIADAVLKNTQKGLGAGDQGTVFGYATRNNRDGNETNYLPAPLYYARELTKKLTQLRETKILRWLRPDGKSQVTVAYKNGVPTEIVRVLVSTQHTPAVTTQTIQTALEPHLRDTLPARLVTKNTKFVVNPSGRFVIGGPEADVGMTGRKLMVDTYGGYARHGGGAFSGKDPTKVDRSGAYYARWVAKNVVACGLADQCEIQVSYAIGKRKPWAFGVNTFGTEKIGVDVIEQRVGARFSFRPDKMIQELDLRQSIYTEATSEGHFGDPKWPWEQLTNLP